MHTSQNLFGVYELTFHKKTHIVQNMIKYIKLLITFIFHNRAVVKKDH